MSDTAQTGLPLARLHDFVLAPGDLVDVDGALQDDGGTLLLLPLGDDDGPKAGEPVGAGVPVQLPAGSTAALQHVVRVVGEWTGAEVVATSVEVTARPRTLRVLSRGPAADVEPSVSADATARATLALATGGEEPHGLLIAFGGERLEDGSELSMAWFTRVTPPVAERLVGVPPQQLAVDVWLVPAPPS
ncbi:hypothetical protein ACFEMC_21645 [Kineococcus sp. DHX-1]|uniref:hypothetical protein n=1 Tax=Kineococcus sp. DHX-1 TaxID=3349638 RepID=UPI0036D2DC21